MRATASSDEPTRASMLVFVLPACVVVPTTSLRVDRRERRPGERQRECAGGREHPGANPSASCAPPCGFEPLRLTPSRVRIPGAFDGKRSAARPSRSGRLGCARVGWIYTELVLVSLAAMLSPTTLTFSRARARALARPFRTGCWFLLGAFTATIAVGIAAAFVIGDVAASSSPRRPKTWVAILDVVVGGAADRLGRAASSAGRPTRSRRRRRSTG